MSDLDGIYGKVATNFADRIEQDFDSEASLKKLWFKHFPALSFDRTDKWSTILNRELEGCWRNNGPVVKAPMTAPDRLCLLEHLAQKLDYNLFSQVLLNLQNWRMISYRTGKVADELVEIEKRWAGRAPSPLAPKSVMFKEASNRDQEDFNRDLSTIRFLRIISTAPPHVSFRVTPKGSTPALTDSANLSMLGIGSDRYLKFPDGIRVHYVCWDKPCRQLELRDDGRFYDPAIKYGFESKSGGEVLHQVLAARHLMVEMYRAIAPDRNKVLLPRMTSLMILTDEKPERIGEVVGTVQKTWPVTLHEGERR